MNLPLSEDIPSSLVQQRTLERGVFASEGGLCVRTELSAFERLPEKFSLNSDPSTYREDAVHYLTETVRQNLNLVSLL